jgi:hypothetical protein
MKIENEKLKIQPRKAQKLKLPNEPIFSPVIAYGKSKRGSLGRERLKIFFNSVFCVTCVSLVVLTVFIVLNFVFFCVFRGYKISVKNTGNEYRLV